MFFGTVVGYNTELPFISIAGEMWRGLRDAGEMLLLIAEDLNATSSNSTDDAARAQAASEMMLHNTEDLLGALRASMKKDRFVQDGSVCHPYVAGVPACGMLFARGNTTTSSPRDSESWRTYSEAMYSGALEDQTIVDIVEWHQTHGSCGKQPCHAWNATDSSLPMVNGSMLKVGVPSGSGGDVENGQLNFDQRQSVCCLHLLVRLNLTAAMFRCRRPNDDIHGARLGRRFAAGRSYRGVPRILLCA